MTEGLFGGVLARGDVVAAVTDDAWVRAMLDSEAALARALSRLGLIDAPVARVIEAVCEVAEVDPAAIGVAAAGGGNPVIPLVKELTTAVASRDAAAARYVHYGATSQDIMDTAAMLVTCRAIDAILGEAHTLAMDLALLAARHRDTPMAGRTLLQQALPTTFGVVVGGWLEAIGSAAANLRATKDRCRAAQLGGAAGTLASLGTDGVALSAAFAEETGLIEPVLPWHTDRGRVLDIAGSLATLAGAVGKPARDITLLAQTEVGELSEVAGAGVGGSSTLPHKRNPVAAVSTLANTKQTPGLVATILATSEQEHQRAAGAWHSEWIPLRDLLLRTGSGVAWLRTSVERLHVDAARMRANLDATGGALLAEHVTSDLTPELGRLAAHELVTEACSTALDRGADLAAVLADRLRGHRTHQQITALLAPESYLGSAGAFTDRALARHHQRTEE
ncbi:3-carboxy-cis,cis-muconate cycloisomerase [Spiractinospora alimapuensis]|uniref:3-carboxy-cis,cis-muconate cycloisomerase n=1 Tax=Spiractinospora alimapuensis TaxID=2820884 RepID=UPI001EE9EE38|nr:3-carboxy-cis,cis-muconate cycloisomerase [Spiractinospora alimapuensis]QVQ53570.1 3-carboxy-cis,cis-muconate cycloisomerase [Spiractinospora alimapuensis]